MAQLRIGADRAVTGNIIRTAAGDQFQFGSTGNVDIKGVRLTGHKVNDLIRKNTVQIDMEGGNASGQSCHIAVGLAYDR